jgi:hypothetical protein
VSKNQGKRNTWLLYHLLQQKKKIMFFVCASKNRILNLLHYTQLWEEKEKSLLETF